MMRAALTLNPRLGVWMKSELAGQLESLGAALGALLLALGAFRYREKTTRAQIAALRREQARDRKILLLIAEKVGAERQMLAALVNG